MPSLRRRPRGRRSRPAPSDSTASTTSTTWWATASSAALAMCARVVPAVSPSGSRSPTRSPYGAPRPVKAGTRHTPSAEETWAARSERNAPPWTSPDEPNVTAVQSRAEPVARMLPSRAYVGVPPMSQASVVAIPSGAPPGSATGVMTEDPVP